MTERPHLGTLVEDMRQWGAQLAIVEHRGVRRFATSYAQLARGAAWFAGELERRRIGPGERVLLCGPNSAGWVACFFGCVLRGVLVVPLDATGTAAFAARVVAETKPRLVVGDAQSAGLGVEWLSLAEVDAALHRPGTVVSIAAAEGLGLDTPLQILFTSGTTGEPKGIVHTHRNLLASLTPLEREIAKYRRYERLVHPLRILHTLPLSHIFGQFMGLWVAPVLGAVLEYEARLEASRLLALLRTERISVLAAVPRVLALLNAELEQGSPGLTAQLAGLRGMPVWRRWWRLRHVHRRLGYRFWAIVCGGATLPDELEEFWTTLGTALIQGYGMTETSALVTLNHPFKPARGTLGAPLPGRELRITETGELLVRGEMVATTTWQHGRLQASSETEGWLATGDLARRDAAGRLQYLGRTGQRLVTSGGLNVYLEDVEAALLAQPGVHEAVVVGLDGPNGPEPAAVLLAGDLAGDPASVASAVAQANATLAPYQRISRWWLWPGLDLPRTATGKVRRHLVESWMREQISKAPGKSRETEDALVALVERVCGSSSRVPQATDGDATTFEALGVDSLGRVQLQAALEQATRRSISDAAMTQARTLGDLRRLAGLPVAASGAFAVQARQQEAARGRAGGRPAEACSAAGPPRPAQNKPPAAQPADRLLYLRWPWAWPLQILRVLFLEACVRPLVWLLAGPKVLSGDGTLAQHAGPVLIVANHVSSFDVPLLLYALPRPLRWRVATAAAGEMMAAWRQGRGNPAGPAIFWLLTLLFNVFPLPRASTFRQAFAHAGRAFDHGLSVLVFPEGTRSHGGPIQPFRGGIGLLAGQSFVPVLPMALISRRSAGGSLRPYTATVRIGKLLGVEEGEAPEAITRRLQDAVISLWGPES